MQRILIQNSSIKCLTKVLGFMKVGALARKMGAIGRKCRKCDMSEYLRSYWLLLNSGFFSYDAWAQQASCLINSTISAEAMRKRIKPETIRFLKNF